MIIRFVIYGLLGWNAEIIWTGLNAALGGDVNLVGHTSVWMFFIYGSAVFLFEPVYDLIKEYSLPLRLCVWIVLIFTVEFVSGILLRIFGIEAWLYSGRLSFGGLIRFDYLPLWAAVGFVFERVCVFLTKHNIGKKER